MTKISLEEITNWLNSMEPTRAIGSISLGELNNLNGGVAPVLETPTKEVRKSVGGMMPKAKPKQPTNTYKAWNTPEVNSLVSMYENGVSWNQIAKNLNRPKGGVYQKLFKVLAERKKADSTESATAETVHTALTTPDDIRKRVTTAVTE